MELARRLLGDGADIIDIGGESATTGRPPVAAQEELELVVPLIEAVAGGLGALVSVDTYKPAVAAAAIAAGARIVNDVSGLRDPELADVCAATGAALVVMHTRAAPRERLQDPDLYEDLVGEVLAFLRERVALAVRAGCRPEQLIVDPGPDFTKTPAQTVALLRAVAAHARAGAAAAARDLAQGLHRRAHRTPAAGAARGHARGARSRGRQRGPHRAPARHPRGGRLPDRAGRAGRRVEVAPQLALQDRLRHQR